MPAIAHSNTKIWIFIIDMKGFINYHIIQVYIGIVN